jgi:hypothetical protein
MKFIKKPDQPCSLAPGDWVYYKTPVILSKSIQEKHLLKI